MSKSGPEEVELRAGQSILVTVDEAYKNECSGERIYVDYKNLPQVMQPGSLIYIDDGLISIRVVSIGADGLSVVGEVLNSGNISSHKGVNLPGTVVDLPSVSEQDKRDLQFGVEQGVDIIFASFIRKPEDVQAIRDVLGPKGARIFIISKIENQVRGVAWRARRAGSRAGQARREREGGAAQCNAVGGQRARERHSSHLLVYGPVSQMRLGSRLVSFPCCFVV